MLIMLHESRKFVRGGGLKLPPPPDPLDPRMLQHVNDEGSNLDIRCGNTYDDQKCLEFAEGPTASTKPHE